MSRLFALLTTGACGGGAMPVGRTGAGEACLVAMASNSVLATRTRSRDFSPDEVRRNWRLQV